MLHFKILTFYQFDSIFVLNFYNLFIKDKYEFVSCIGLTCFQSGSLIFNLEWHKFIYGYSNLNKNLLNCQKAFVQESTCLNFRSVIKELSFCHKLWFLNPYISAIQCWRSLVYYKINSAWSNQKSKFKISRVYTLRLQRYRDYEFGVCGKNDDFIFLKKLICELHLKTWF